MMASQASSQVETPSSDEAGDIAVCGSFTTSEPILSQPARERACFIAPLGSRSDLERLLRRLLRHAGVRHLVLSGDDAEPTGESLLALWQAGLDQNGRLPGARGILSAELDVSTVDTLRGNVQLLDWRGRPSAEVARGMLELPVLPRVRKPRDLHVAPPCERQIFPSRKTTFPIFSGDAGDAWLQLLNLLLRIGSDRQTAAGTRVAEALNAVVTIEPAAAEGDFPGFWDFNRQDFERYFRRFDWQGGERLETVCARLQEAFGAGADVTDLFCSGDPRRSKLVPALSSATFNVADGKLFASFVLCRADVYTDWPLVAASLLRLQRHAAERAGLAIGAAVFFIQAARLADGDWQRATGVLQEFFKRPLPLQIDPAGIFLFGNDGGRARAMLLDHDASTIFWEEAFSDPEDLSWYIVDVMPWLLPQHIRYVGQECAALMHAIRTGECYVQG